MSPHYPEPYGLSATPAQQLVIHEEFVHAGIAQPSTVIGEWALPTILAHGTKEQQDTFVRPTLRGDIEWCQLFSEPGAGSDLASLSTRAEKVEGGWRLNGQKVWNSMAQHADWGICLARTNPDVPKHKGISYFLVDMKNSEGLDVRPLREANGALHVQRGLLQRRLRPRRSTGRRARRRLAAGADHARQRAGQHRFRPDRVTATWRACGLPWRSWNPDVARQWARWPLDVCALGCHAPRLLRSFTACSPPRDQLSSWRPRNCRPTSGWRRLAGSAPRPQSRPGPAATARC